MNKENIILKIKALQSKIAELDEKLLSSGEEVSALDLDTQLMYLRMLYDSYLSLRRHVKPAEREAKKAKIRRETVMEEEKSEEVDEDSATLPLLFAEEPETGKENNPVKEPEKTVQEEVVEQPEPEPESKPEPEPEPETKEEPVGSETAVLEAEKPEENSEEESEPKEEQPSVIAEKAANEEITVSEAEDLVGKEAVAEPEPPAEEEKPIEEDNPQEETTPQEETNQQEDTDRMEEAAIDLEAFEPEMPDFDMDAIEFELDDEDDENEDPHRKSVDNGQSEDYPPYYPGLNPRAMNGELEQGGYYQGHSTLGEHFANRFPSLNDQLSQKRGENALGERMQKEQISDLTKSIDLNLKFLFIKELFKGDATLLTQELGNLNRCQHLEKALAYFDDMKLKYHWKEENEAVNKLYELILRKYAR